MGHEIKVTIPDEKDCLGCKWKIPTPIDVGDYRPEYRLKDYCAIYGKVISHNKPYEKCPNDKKKDGE